MTKRRRERGKNSFFFSGFNSFTFPLTQISRVIFFFIPSFVANQRRMDGPSSKILQNTLVEIWAENICQCSTGNPSCHWKTWFYNTSAGLSRMCKALASLPKKFHDIYGKQTQKQTVTVPLLLYCPHITWDFLVTTDNPLNKAV